MEFHCNYVTVKVTPINHPATRCILNPSKDDLNDCDACVGNNGLEMCKLGRCGTAVDA